ncbi:hypothetical protein KAR91_07570 [Candidatus Pacearchaeota archaeon]|nr:hypothetical protein [Candidatus Pacearchaeota archaeon]
MGLEEDDATKTIEASGKDIKIFRDSQGRAILGVVLMDEDGDNLLSLVQDGESASGAKGVLIFGKDSDGNTTPIIMDGESGGLITITTEHAKIHEGISFERHIDSNNATVATLNVAFKTGPIGEVNIIQGWSASDTVLFEIIEGATWDQGSGTALDISNHNRNRGASTLILEDKNQATFTASNQVIQDVTNVSGGTTFERQLTYEPKQAGGNTRASTHEWELMPDTTYVFRITKTSAGNSKMSIDLHWYEVID